jgi:hypothetical protein
MRAQAAFAQSRVSRRLSRIHLLMRGARTPA